LAGAVQSYACEALSVVEGCWKGTIATRYGITEGSVSLQPYPPSHQFLIYLEPNHAEGDTSLVLLAASLMCSSRANSRDIRLSLTLEWCAIRFHVREFSTEAASSEVVLADDSS
jgi:hypothetical protein